MVAFPKQFCFNSVGKFKCSRKQSRVLDSVLDTGSNSFHITEVIEFGLLFVVEDFTYF